MYNWSTDTEYLKKFPQELKLWKMEQLINFGLGGEKLDKSDVKKYLGKLKIDKAKRNYLEFLLS